MALGTKRMVASDFIKEYVLPKNGLCDDFIKMDFFDEDKYGWIWAIESKNEIDKDILSFRDALVSIANTARFIESHGQTYPEEAFKPLEDSFNQKLIISELHTIVSDLQKIVGIDCAGEFLDCVHLEDTENIWQECLNAMELYTHYVARRITDQEVVKVPDYLDKEKLKRRYKSKLRRREDTPLASAQRVSQLENVGLASKRQILRCFGETMGGFGHSTPITKKEVQGYKVQAKSLFDEICPNESDEYLEKFEKVIHFFDSLLKEINQNS